MHAFIERVNTGELRADAVQVRLGLRGRHAALQASRHHEIESGPGIQPVPAFNLRLHHHGNPDIGPIINLGAVESPRRNPQYGVLGVVDPNLLADDVRTSTEPALPARVAQDGERTAVRVHILGGREEASDRRPDSERPEIIPGDQVSPNQFRSAVLG